MFVSVSHAFPTTSNHVGYHWNLRRLPGAVEVGCMPRPTLEEGRGGETYFFASMNE